MDLYKIFDYVSGVGCLVYASAFLFKKVTSSTERILVFFYMVMGMGLLFRGLSNTLHSEQLALIERFIFVLLPLSLTLYYERIARLKLGFYFKLYVLGGAVFNFLLFFFLPEKHFIYFHMYLLFYEVTVLSYLCIKLIEKVFKTQSNSEKSVCLSLLIFASTTIVLLMIDWHLKMNLGEDRITSMIVFPACFISFLISYSPDSYSLKNIMRGVFVDLLFLFVIMTFVYAISKEATPPSLLVFFIVSLYVKMIFKTFNVLYNSSEKIKSNFFLAQVRRLGKVKVQDLPDQIKKIENVSSVKILSREDFEKESLSGAYAELSKGEVFFSKIEVDSIRLEMEDDLDKDLIHLMKYSLDAFQADFIYFVPSTHLCVAIKFDGLNLDSTVETKAYSIFTQITMTLYREGKTHV